MLIYAYVAEPGDDEADQSIVHDLTQLCADRSDWVLVDARGDAASRASRDLGLQFNARAVKHLKQPLNQLYALARRHHCDFAVGELVNGRPEDVCYFGAEEGRPDMFEVGMYLGLS